MMIGWTTCETREDALRLARGLVEAKLAACAQISGPLTSVYRWDGRIEAAEEYRLTVKFPARAEPSIRAWLETHHPYEVPQWVAVTATAVSEKYLNWAEGDST
ncbi:MAG: divalent-cation tolerance protein CutA [Verrucomicrobia bacterium]|nr:MAG: divalent-cation tolerance protein CutA [Verrucomicrobiota bacterium]